MRMALPERIAFAATHRDNALATTIGLPSYRSIGLELMNTEEFTPLPCYGFKPPPPKLDSV